MLDKTLPTVASCLDVTFRAVGGVPTYVLTDNERTVTIDHVARIAVRNPELATIARFYGTTVRTCVPADPASKGGSESTVRIAKRDLVPTLVNLRDCYKHFAELEEACVEFAADVNGRIHRDTRQRPDERLVAERIRLHPLPDNPFTACFGETRRVGRDSTVSVGSVRYSVPHQLVDEKVWVRFHGDDLIVTAIRGGATVEVARHRRSTPGNPVIRDEHYPPSSRGERAPKPTSAAEAEFLAIGPGAAAWLIEAAAVGAHRIRVKMAEAVVLAKLHGLAPVDRALGTAAIAGRFGEGDLLAILQHQAETLGNHQVRPSETHSLQPGTSAWAAFGNDGRPTP